MAAKLAGRIGMRKSSLWKTTSAVFALWAVTAVASSAQTFTNLVSFGGADGCAPYTMSMVQGTDGNLYGTADAGGTDNLGTIFRVTPGGTLTTLHDFSAPGGINPINGLDLAADGNFYGATWYGGTNQWGTIFKVSLSGELTTLYDSSSTVGVVNTLVQGENGNFYGTGCIPNSATATPCLAYGPGTVFKLTPGGTLTVLDTLSGVDGWGPSELIQATDGNFYGATYGGGASCCGTVFKISPGGALTTLHSFSGTDGNGPTAGLVQGIGANSPERDLYGTAFSGGADGYGSVYKITLEGTLTTLHNFDGTEGANPYAGLVQGTDGNFYGTTLNGGTDNWGTVFEITPRGRFTMLHTFTGPDGLRPYGGLVQATDGSFYGTTDQGGSTGCGTIFSLSVGLGPFVRALPHSGQVGRVIRILGTDLTGATAVTFNGAPAAFTIDAPTEITATLPAGATSGKIQVTTPGGTLMSAGPFTVLP